MLKTKHTFFIIMAGVLYCILYFRASILEGAKPWVRWVFTQDLPDSNAPSSPQPTQTVIQDMVLIPAGEFIMGSNPKIGYDTCKKYIDILPYDEKLPGCHKNEYLREAPLHKVFLDAFYMDKYEVTQEHYKTVVGKNPSKFKGSNSPVENVNWSQATQYCESLGKRLPTEAEWEKAAKGGEDTIFSWGNKMEGGRANYWEHKGTKEELDDGYKFTAPVGSYPSNGYGLFEMSGNVMEWVQDWADHNYYAKSPRKNPEGPREGRKKVLRGGSYHDHPAHIRVAWRDEYNPKSGSDSFGFRCALSVP